MSTKFDCSRCSATYKYKGGLTAHIKRKHPIQDKPATTVAKKSPENAVKKNAWKVTNLNTQVVDILLEEEAEFYDAVDEFEHGVGINTSMVDWGNIDFESPFGTSGEFEGRLASVASREKCTDCEINSKTLNMQTDLITKLDKKLQNSQEQLKISRKQEKQLEIKLADALKNIKRFENENFEKSNSITYQCRECEFVSGSQEEVLEHKREKKAESRANDKAYNKELEEGPVPEEERKCEKCNFSSKNRVLLQEHKDKSHKGFKCTRCEAVLPDMESLKIHREKLHNDPGFTFNFKCTPCKENFRTDEDLMEHMCQIHLTESQREGHGLYKYESYTSNPQKGWRPALCRNGPQCFYNRQGRCNFFHHQAPQWQQGRPPHQSPSNQWQEVPPRRKHVQQGQGDQHAHERQAQGHKYWSIPPQGVMATPWCLHGRGCPMGQYCVLRHEDFPNMPQQGRQ